MIGAIIRIETMLPENPATMLFPRQQPISLAILCTAPEHLDAVLIPNLCRFDGEKADSGLHNMQTICALDAQPRLVPTVRHEWIYGLLTDAVTQAHC
jgi:hypothetical protein